MPYDDEDQNRLMETIEIVDVLEKDYIDLGITTVTVYVMNKGPTNANLSAMYMSDISGNILQANLSLDEYMLPGEIIGLSFTKPITINWTAFLAVTARGNIAYYLYEADNERLPDYIYLPGFMIGYDAAPIAIEGPPYTTESLETILDYIHETLDPEYVKNHTYYTSNGVKLTTTGNNITMKLSNQADGECIARFLFYNPSSDQINLSIVRETNANEHFGYLEVYLFNFATSHYDLIRNIIDAAWSNDDIENILVVNADDYIEDNLFDMQFLLNYGGNGPPQFKFNIILDSATSAYTFNAEYIVTLSDPDPSISLVRGILFDLVGTSNVAGNYSIWLFNYTSGLYDLKLLLSNSSGTFDNMFLSETESNYYAFRQGVIFDYLDSNYNVKYMIVPDFEINQNLILSFSKMHIELFIDIDQ